MRTPVAPLLALATLAACDRAGDGTVGLPARPPARPSGVELPPVAVNPNSPVQYPAVLASQGIEGTVLLRLYVDAEGKLVPDSTRIAESSGYPALDSAAMQAAPSLRFAPAERDGQKVAAAFLQPVNFRTPQGRGVTP
ncbi:MAG TPA: energy transducer TonB [Gemmatimonadales bacterium]|nr:energy transducer TonB [Gemmatimonadales bacterium]